MSKFMDHEKRKGFLVVVSGPSAVGKGTVVHRAMELAEERGIELWVSVSFTSRQIREGEADGGTYFYIEKEEFERKIADGDILEHTTYSGHYYGTSRTAVEEKLAAGIDVILEIEVDGARQIKALFDNSITVFVMPPSMEELETRIRLRGRETEEEIRHRLGKGREEIQSAGWYDYILPNDIIEDAAENLLTIIAAESFRSARSGIVEI